MEGSILAKQDHAAAHAFSLAVSVGEFSGKQIQSGGLFYSSAPSGLGLIGREVAAIEHQIAPAIKNLKTGDGL